MTDKIIVLVTCESREEAGRIAEAVVGERLAACVNVVGGVESCYVWEGERTWSREVLCLMKTTKARFEELRDRVKGLHSYSVPEIVAVPIDAALEKYAEWIEGSVSG
jgi:periplasmic divalent cation tolerance protein